MSIQPHTMAVALVLMRYIDGGRTPARARLAVWRGPAIAPAARRLRQAQSTRGCNTFGVQACAVVLKGTRGLTMPPAVTANDFDGNGSVHSANEPPAEKRRRRGGGMLKPGRFVLFLLGTLTLAAAFAAAQTREGVRTELTVSGTVTAVDHTARTVTLRSDQGHVVTVDVPASATRFEQVKVGDIVDDFVLRPRDHPPETGRRAGG